MKISRSIFLLLLVPALTFPQGAVEPIRVSVVAPRDGLNDAASGAARDELRRLRDVAIVREGDYEIQINALPIIGTGCEGYAAGALIVNRRKGRMLLRTYTSATPEGLARQIVTDAYAKFRQGQDYAWR